MRHPGDDQSRESQAENEAPFKLNFKPKLYLLDRAPSVGGAVEEEDDGTKEGIGEACEGKEAEALWGRFNHGDIVNC